MISFTKTQHAPRGFSAEHLGLIPMFLSAYDPRPASEQFDEAYSHGGGWRGGTSGFKLHDDNCIQYPGERKLKPLATAQLRDETIAVYDMAFVAIIQPDRSYEIERMD